MNCFYKTTTRYTYEEYKRYNWSLRKTKKHMIWWSILMMLVLFCGFILKEWFFIVFSVIYIPIVFGLQHRQIKKVYNSNKVTQDIDVDFEFYDTYFTETTELSQAKIEYSKLHKIIETKTNFYLMIAKNQGYILVKANMPEGLAEFLKGIKI